MDIDKIYKAASLYAVAATTFNRVNVAGAALPIGQTLQNEGVALTNDLNSKKDYPTGETAGATSSHYQVVARQVSPGYRNITSSMGCLWVIYYFQ